MRIHHVAIKVSDPERSLIVYRDLLGLEEQRRWLEPDGRLRSIWLGLDSEAFLALEHAADPGHRGDEQAGHHCLAFEMKLTERARWRERLEAAGHPVERETAYSLFFRDRDRNLLALSHYPEPDSSFLGR